MDVILVCCECCKSWSYDVKVTKRYRGKLGVVDTDRAHPELLGSGSVGSRLIVCLVTCEIREEMCSEY